MLGSAFLACGGGKNLYLLIAKNMEIIFTGPSSNEETPLTRPHLLKAPLPHPVVLLLGWAFSTWITGHIQNPNYSSMNSACTRGRRLALTVYEPSKREIRRMDLSVCLVVPLPSPGSWKEGPVWGPDGSSYIPCPLVVYCGFSKVFYIHLYI